MQHNTIDIPQTLRDVLAHEGVVAIATQGPDGPHLVNTWNTYVELTSDGRMLIPVGGMNTTERNIASDPRVLLTIGSREVAGRIGPGTGFLIRGSARFLVKGDEFSRMKQRFAWMRALLEVTITSLTQTL